MDLRDIRYFLAIAEEGTITRAAERLHMAQPPLSRQLKQLEDKLGTQLVERGRKNIQLTDAGRLLYNRAEHLLEMFESTVQEVAELNKGASGTLKIGTITSSGATLLPQWIRKFHTQYPGINFQLWEGDTQRITELLKSGVIEIGIVRFPFDSTICQSICLPEEPFVAAMHRTMYQCGKRPEAIDLAELADQPLMLHRRYEAMVAEHCRQAGFEPRIVCKSDDIMPILVWADAGIGVTIVPKSAVGLIPSSNLIYKEISVPSLITSAAVIWLQNHYLSASARYFLQLFTRERQGVSS